MNALHAAVENDDFDMVQILLELNADSNGTNQVNKLSYLVS